MEEPDPTEIRSQSSSVDADGVTDSVIGGMLQARLDSQETQGGKSMHGWQPPSVEELQAALPQYEIVAFIARGGMGAIYKGIQKTLDRTVAIKILPSDLGQTDLEFTERFKLESRAMAKVNHPYIVAVYDAGETAGGLLYFVMEFIDGVDVAQLIKREGRLEVSRAVEIICAVCKALAYAHEEGIIHRDIKPSNIMIERRGRIKVADFGLAKALNMDSQFLTRSSMSMGTPEYMAPEAMTPGMKIDHRADLYAVGVMLYQLLTGEIPRGRFRLPSGLIPKLDPKFDIIVDKAMQTQPELRYSSAIEIQTALGKVHTISGPVQPAGEKQSSTTFITWGKVALGLMLISMIISAGWLGWNKFNDQDKKGSPSTADTQTLSTPLTQLPEPLKLWDTEDTLPSSSKIQWKNGVIQLDGDLTYRQTMMKNFIFRADVLMNADAEALTMNVRLVNRGRIPGEDVDDFSCYTLEMARAGTFQISQTQHGERLPLKTWPHPRRYETTEWVNIEFQVIGDRLSLLADGQMIGSIIDHQIQDIGQLNIRAIANGFVRDVEVVNLDSLDEAEVLKLLNEKPSK